MEKPHVLWTAILFAVIFASTHSRQMETRILKIKNNNFSQKQSPYPVTDFKINQYKSLIVGSKNCHGLYRDGINERNKNLTEELMSQNTSEVKGARRVIIRGETDYVGSVWSKWL